MAIVIRGKSSCFICGKTLEENQEIVGFPPFVINEADKLFKFNDTSCHKTCFLNHPLYQQVLERLEFRQNMIGIDNRICIVCGKKIEHPDNYFLIDYLADDPTDPLYSYNYTKMHKSCLHLWKDLFIFKNLLMRLKTSKFLKGKAIDYLISSLEKAIKTK